MMNKTMSLAAVPVAALSSLCATSTDCSLNGDCISGTCHCDPGWVGSVCSTLDLELPDISQSYVAPGGTSAWGMSVVQDKTTKMYHGYISEFKNKCKLGSWTTNSFVNHVVASAPEGPWEQKGQVIGVWSHNPKLAYSPNDETWLIYHIGDGNQTYGPVQNCNDTEPEFSWEKPRIRDLSAGSGSGPYMIHHSTSLDGPWTLEPQAFNYTNSMTLYPGMADNKDGKMTNMGKMASADKCREACIGLGSSDCTSYTWMGSTDERCLVRADSYFEPVASSEAETGRPWIFRGDNPSPLIDQTTGEVRVLYRTDSTGGEAASAGYDVASMIGQARSPSWRGPYTPLSAFDGPVSSPQYPYEENEDPFLWQNSRGFHGLFHACTWTDSLGANWPVAEWAGRYAYSEDGTKWTFSPVPAYNGTIVWKNGTTSILSRMERPYLVFDENNNPTHLFNGVQRYDWDQYTFNLMHSIRQPTRDLVV